MYDDDLTIRLRQIKEQKSRKVERQIRGELTCCSRVWVFLNSQFGGWLLTYVLIGLLAFFYQTIWVPSSAKSDRRDELIFELAYRSALALEISKPNVLNGANRDYITKPQFFDSSFRHLALELRSLTGSKGKELLRFASSPPKDDADLQELLGVIVAIADEYSVKVITVEELRASKLPLNQKAPLPSQPATAANGAATAVQPARSDKDASSASRPALPHSGAALSSTPAMPNNGTTAPTEPAGPDKDAATSTKPTKPSGGATTAEPDEGVLK